MHTYIIIRKDDKKKRRRLVIKTIRARIKEKGTEEGGGGNDGARYRAVVLEKPIPFGTVYHGTIVAVGLLTNTVRADDIHFKVSYRGETLWIDPENFIEIYNAERYLHKIYMQLA